jgi:hypothetical protein
MSPAEGYAWHWSVNRWLEDESPTVYRLTDPGLLARDLAAFIAALRQPNSMDGPPAGTIT